MTLSHEQLAQIWEEITKLKVEQGVLRESVQILKESNKFLTEEVNKLRMGEAVLKTTVRIYIGVAGIAWGIFGTIIGTIIKAFFP